MFNYGFITYKEYGELIEEQMKELKEQIEENEEEEGKVDERT